METDEHRILERSFILTTAAKGCAIVSIKS